MVMNSQPVLGFYKVVLYSLIRKYTKWNRTKCPKIYGSCWSPCLAQTTKIQHGNTCRKIIYKYTIRSLKTVWIRPFISDRNIIKHTFIYISAHYSVSVCFRLHATQSHDPWQFYVHLRVGLFLHFLHRLYFTHSITSMDIGC